MGMPLCTECQRMVSDHRAKHLTGINATERSPEDFGGALSNHLPPIKILQVGLLPLIMEALWKMQPAYLNFQAALKSQPLSSNSLGT